MPDTIFGELGIFIYLFMTSLRRQYIVKDPPQVQSRRWRKWVQLPQITFGEVDFELLDWTCPVAEKSTGMQRVIRRR